MDKFSKNTCALILGAVIALASGCGKEPEPEIVLVPEEAANRYTVTEAKVSDVVKTEKITLKYTQKEPADHSFELSGYSIKGIYVSKGDHVKKGDLIAELDRSEVEDNLLEIDNLLNEYDTELKFLYERKALEYDQAKRMLDSGELKNEAAYEDYIKQVDDKYAEKIKEYEDDKYYQELRREYYGNQLEEGRIYASMDGVVSYVRSYSSFQQSIQGQKVVSIVDSAKCAFSCDAVYTDHFTEGGKYVVKAINDVEYETVFHLSEDGLTMEFELVEPDYGISIGTKAYYHVILDISKDVVAVDKLAVHHAGDLYYVYYLDDNDIRTVEYVDIGLTGDDLCEITSGVNPGDILVLK